jgi:hypothetical protein
MVLVALLFLPCMVVAVTLALPILLFVTSVVAMPFLLLHQSKYETSQDVVTDHASSHTASSRRVNPPESVIQSDPSILRASQVSPFQRCIRKSVSFQTHVASECPVEAPESSQHRHRSALLPPLRTSPGTNPTALKLVAPRHHCSSRCNSLTSTIDLREEMKHQFDYLEQYLPGSVPLGQKLDQW